MATNRRLPAPGQFEVDPEVAWDSWNLDYFTGYDEADPVMRKNGLIRDAVTRGRRYHLPVPALGLGAPVRGEDGNEWPEVDPQSYEVQGRVDKLGPRAVAANEEDFFEVQVPQMQAMFEALGRDEKLHEDQRGAESLELGFEKNVQINGKTFDKRGWDLQPIFSDKHYTDAIRKTPGIPNAHALRLSPDNALSLWSLFFKIVDESGNGFLPMDRTKFLLVVNPQRMGDAEKTCLRVDVPELGAAVRNPFYQKATPLAIPQLKDPDRWYLIAVVRGRAPIARVVLQQMTRRELGPDSDLWLNKQRMKRYAYERADYRMPDHRYLMTSKG